ncbi:hypothetical protein KXQ82_17510 [Mucilaginibacter sp. HMF5004]|uniref:hypothetical protein n=1 Tax=Mucilaginibacter rivuli TaxID=2857527 RepID=UPI001C5E3E8D|nr:hypothetical protein [Mucilaginibacter rivuli]MBW4891529.1 hypothetical protein [Mucilaginibacter rivuli]
MKSNLLVAVLLCCLLSIGQSASAQKKPVATAPQKNFTLFFEKVYVHTDRDYYATGEDIWFKAYLVNGLSSYPTYTSNNLYIDLISPDSKIMSREIIRLDQGMGVGDFKLTDSVPEGVYHLKAYTNWMRNFGDNFIFDKKITIHSVQGVKSANPQVKEAGKRGKATEIPPVNIDQTYKINFFPEGGSMIEGVATVVGYKAEDAMGKGVKVSGDVTSAQGDVVGHFESTDMGLGSFTILPVAGTKYMIKGTYKNNLPFTSALPDVLSTGYAIHIVNTDSVVQVVVSTNQATLDKNKGKKLTLASKHADKYQWEGKFDLADLQMSIGISKAKLSPGVSSILLFDELMHPNCERLVYINNKNNVKLSVVPDKAVYASKEKTTVTITATDSKNQPVKAELSLAAIDGTVVPADESNIVAYLLLQSDIRGKIENAAQYFDVNNVNRFKQMDMLLLTQGWRDFVWKRLQDSTLKLSYLPEAGFTVSGRVRSVMVNKSIANANITLYAPGAKGNKIFATQTDQDGKYYLDGIELYGNQTLKLTSRNLKGKKDGWLFLDTLANDAFPVTPTPIFNEEPSPQLLAFNKASTTRVNEANRFKVSNVVQLKQVNITDKPKTVTLMDETLQSFGYPEYEFNITKADYTYKTLEQFLIQKVPGAIANPDKESGIMFMFGGQKVFPKFVVDKREDMYERLDYYNLSMDQINTVSVRHLISMGGGDRILVYLSLKPTAFDKKEFSLVNQDVNGYYNARTFYAPNYEYSSTKSDQRTTIHWEPMITTDEKGQATVSFYNADPKSKIRVVVQGLSNTGVPLSAVAGYSIK